MMDRALEKRMLMSCYTDKLQEDFPMPPQQHLRLGEEVGDLEQSRFISSPHLLHEITCPDRAVRGGILGGIRYPARCNGLVLCRTAGALESSVFPKNAAVFIGIPMLPAISAATYFLLILSFLIRSKASTKPLHAVKDLISNSDDPYIMKSIIIALLTCISLHPASAAEEFAKKGICLGGQGRETEKKLESLNLGWHYNWSPSWQGKKIKDVQYVPMFWGDKEWCHSGLGGFRVAKSKMADSPLLTYNEPDGKDQSNMTVERALELWPTMEKTNRRLGSPAAVHPDNEWMKAFMKGAEEKKLRVDFICVHWYGSNDALHFINRLEQVHALYKKPIWITEFAIADWKAKTIKDNKQSETDVLRFMRAVLPQLERLDYVERYAWFTAPVDDPALGTSALFHKDGTLTKLGEYYAKFKK
jgi:hypothetical protein